MDDCIFCKIIEGKISSDKLYEDDKIIVFRDIHPKAKVHLLIVSKEHIESLLHTKNNHADLLSHMLNIQKELAKKEGLDKGFRTVINTGRGGGQEIDHLHVHMMGNGLSKF